MQLRHLVKNEMLLVKTGNGLFCVKALGLLGQRGAFPKASLLRQKMAPVDDPPHVIGFSPSGARTRLPPEAPRPFRGPRSTLPAQHTCPQCGPTLFLQSKRPVTAVVQPRALPAHELKTSGEKYTHLTEKQVTINTWL